MKNKTKKNSRRFKRGSSKKRGGFNYSHRKTNSITDYLKNVSNKVTKQLPKTQLPKMPVNIQKITKK